MITQTHRDTLIIVLCASKAMEYGFLESLVVMNKKVLVAKKMVVT